MGAQGQVFLWGAHVGATNPGQEFGPMGQNELLLLE